MKTHSKRGWVFEVESPDGILFYAVAEADPDVAEKFLRSEFKFGKEIAVYVYRELEDETFNAFRMFSKKISGPF